MPCRLSADIEKSNGNTSRETTSKGERTMSKAIRYYSSKTGHTAKMANAIGDAIGLVKFISSARPLSSRAATNRPAKSAKTSALRFPATSSGARANSTVSKPAVRTTRTLPMPLSGRKSCNPNQHEKTLCQTAGGLVRYIWSGTVTLSMVSTLDRAVFTQRQRNRRAFPRPASSTYTRQAL